MALIESTDRREYLRLTIPLPALFRLRGSSAVRQGTVTNISSAGAALLTPVPLPPDSVIDQLRFSLESARKQNSVEVSVAAGVVTTEQQQCTDSSERYRSGLVFLNLKGKSFEKVSRIIELELWQSAQAQQVQATV